MDKELAVIISEVIDNISLQNSCNPDLSKVQLI